jgi:pilus assembly protein CpaE
MLVANRFQKRNPVGLPDAEKALGGMRLLTLSNDFRNVVHGINHGLPLATAAPSSVLRQELRGLAENLVPKDARDSSREMS